MIWRAMLHWVIAGCLSATAFDFTAGYQAPVSGPQTGKPVLSAPAALPVGGPQESPLKPIEPAAPTATPTIVGSSQSSGEKTNSLPVSTRPQAQAKAVVPGTTTQVGPSEQSVKAAGETAVAEEYKVQTEDVLQITVYEEPDLSTKVRVSGSGEINFPLLGRVSVAGLSVIEVQEKITKLLAKDYMVNPQVQVFVDTYHARNVFVAGAVSKPGSYTLPTGKPTTVMEAITMAAGFTKDAAENRTRIIRIEKGKETTINVKANDIVKKGDKSKDVEVLPNDVVFVPESFF